MKTTRITAEEIMTRRLAVTSPQTHVVEAIERLIDHGVSGLPVVTATGELVGRFSERSALAALDLALLSNGSRVAAALNTVTASDVMDRSRLLLRHDQDVFECARQLLRFKVSGVPVVDHDDRLLGVFSEKSVMHAFVGLCWEQLPSSNVTAWIDRHDDRQISEDMGLEDILILFQNTPYRRLIVLRNGKFIGQVTRRDALQAALATSREPIATSGAVRGDQQIGVRATVEGWMHREIVHTPQDADVLKIANQFLRTSARQLAVLNGNRLDGQISRSDLLRAVERFFPINSTSNGAQPLYLTSLDRHDARAVL